MTAPTPERVLFVTWDGPGLAYLESLFLPIFAGLAQQGYPFDVLQFRWGSRDEEDRCRSACQEHGIGYRAVTVIRRAGGLGPFLTALAGGRHVRKAVRAFGSQLVMPRAILPSLATLRAGVDRIPPIVLDADGIEADERVEFAGLPSTGAVYRILRDVEAQAVRRARSVIVRTPGARDILMDRTGPPLQANKYHVVTNGRDEHIFSPGDPASRAALRSELGIATDAPLIVYAGSVGRRYNTPRIGEFARAVHRLRPDTRMLLLSSSPADAERELGAVWNEIEPFSLLRSAAPFDVPRHLAAGDVGTAFIHTSFSTRGIAPVKTSEYLLCGVPIVGATGVGDNEPLLMRGLMFDEDLGVEAAAHWFVTRVLPERERFRQDARELGVQRFSLRRSIKDYQVALEAAKA